MDNDFECTWEDVLKQRYSVLNNTCAPDEHVLQIERGIRIVKECAGATISLLPLTDLPTMIITHIVLFCVLWLDLFPPVGGVSPTNRGNHQKQFYRFLSTLEDSIWRICTCICQTSRYKQCYEQKNSWRHCPGTHWEYERYIQIHDPGNW